MAHQYVREVMFMDNVEEQRTEEESGEVDIGGEASSDATIAYGLDEDAVFGENDLMDQDGMNERDTLSDDMQFDDNFIFQQDVGEEESGEASSDATIAYGLDEDVVFVQDDFMEQGECEILPDYIKFDDDFVFQEVIGEDESGEADSDATIAYGLDEDVVFAEDNPIDQGGEADSGSSNANGLDLDVIFGEDNPIDQVHIYGHEISPDEEDYISHLIILSMIDHGMISRPFQIEE